MAIRLAFVNQKGGVGKTTLAAHFAIWAARQGQQVLAVDNDPQGHLSATLGCQQANTGLSQLVLQEAEADDCLFATTQQGLSLLPADPGLLHLERHVHSDQPGLVLAQALQPLLDRFDLVVIDSPPASGFLLVNTLLSSDQLAIPVTADYFGLNGLSHLFHTLDNFEQHMNQPWPKWVALSRLQQRRRLSREVTERLRQRLGSSLCDNAVAEAAALAEAPGFGQTVFDYSPRAKSAQQMTALCAELWEKIHHGN